MEIERGTGNVFGDLGYPDAEERQTKLRLAYAINRIVEERRLSQAVEQTPRSFERGVLSHRQLRAR